MANHIRIGKVDNIYLVEPVSNFINDPGTNFRGLHFRVVGKTADSLGGNQNAVFARKWDFSSAVKEIGNVGVFLRFGNVELAEFFAA